MRLKDVLAALVSPQYRAKLAYERARRTVKRHGAYVYTEHMVWKDQPFFNAARERAKGVDGIPDPRSFVLQSLIRSIADVQGDVAECGVRQGRSTLFMLTADEAGRHVHLFDSFAGLSEPGAEDRKASGDGRWKSGDLSTDETLARRNLAGFDNVTFHVGWIPERFADVTDGRFALVHVDVDLFQPTLDTLAFFYDRVAPNGIIVCDDYGSAHCPGARKAFDDFFADRPEGIIELPTGQAVVVKRG